MVLTQFQAFKIIQYIKKNPEKLVTNSSVHIYIDRINNILVLKIKAGYKLDLQIPAAIKLVGRTKKITDKTKNVENVPSLELVKVGLIECNLVDNQYQHTSDTLYSVMPNKCYICLLNVESGNLVFLKTNNAAFDEIAITFADQNDRPLVTEDKVNLKFFINKYI